VSSPLTLDILIRTVAQGAGLNVTNEQVQKLTASLQSAAAAGEQVNITTEEIKRRLTEQTRETERSRDAWSRMSEAEKDVMRQQAQTAVRTIEATEAKKRAADTAKLLAKDLGSLKSAGQGVSQVFAGLSSGGVGGAIQSFRGMLQVVTSLRTGVGALVQQLGRGLAAGAAVAAPAIIAIKAMGQAAETTAKNTQKTLDDAAKASEERTKRLEEHSARVQAALQKELKLIQELQAGYDKLNAAQDRGDARQSALNKAETDRQLATIDTREKEALAKATTPERRAAIAAAAERERTKVRERAGQIDRDNVQLRAGVRIAREEENIRNQSDVLRRAQTEANQAELDAAKAEDVAKTANKENPNSEAARSRTKEALEARARAKTLREKADQVRVAVGENQEASRIAIEQARTQQEVGSIEQQTANTQRAGRLVDLREQEKQLVRRVGSEQAAKGSENVDPKLLSELRELRAAIETLAAATATAKAAPAAAAPMAVPAAVVPAVQVQGADGAREGSIVTSDGRTIPIKRESSGGGTITRGDQTITVLKDASKAIAEKDAAVIEFAKETKKSADITKRQIKNTREGG
jgi:hypothetical protein